MVSINKYLKAVNHKDYDLFRKIIEKDGDYIFNEISKYFDFYDENVEKAYDFFLLSLWDSLAECEKPNENLDYYLKEIVPKIIFKEIPSLVLKDYKIIIVRSDTDDEKVIKKREKVFRNYRVIKKLIIRDFKNHFGINNVIFEDLIPCLNNSRYTDYYGHFAVKQTLTMPFFYLVIVTEDRFYSNAFTIKYDELEGAKLYSENSINDIKNIYLKHNKNYNVNRILIKFSNGREFGGRESFHQDMYRFYDFMNNYIKEKGLIVKKVGSLEDYIYLYC